MNPRILFIASCIALVTSAFTFSVRGEILQDMGNAFQLTQEQKGDLEGAVFLGMAFSMVVGGFICDLLGMKRIMILAFLCHLVGVCGTIWAPHNQYSFWWLWISAFIMGCGNGMVETGINPLAASLYPEKKTHIMNILHAWWPGGLIIGGLSVLYLRKGIDLGFVEITGLDLKYGDFANWQVSLFLILIPSIVYGLVVLSQQFPQTERVAAGISFGDMFKEAFRPLFLILAFCMLLTAATELGPQKWQESVMQRTAQISGTLILVYTSGMMFVLRHFAGALVHRASPIMLLLVSSVLAAVGLYLLSSAKDATTAFTYATIYGLGIAFFWPTMLGVTAERFPKGGALLLCLMGSFGNLAISRVLPIMGGIYDSKSVAYLEDKDKALAGRVVRGKAINQDVAKKIDLIGSLSPAEAAAIKPGSWLRKEQQEKLKTLEGKSLEEQMKELNLTEEQRMVWLWLHQDTTAFPFDGAELNPVQKEVAKQFEGIRNSIGALRLLKEVEANRLTGEQRQKLVQWLHDKGAVSAAEKLPKLQDPDPPSLSTHERKMIKAGVAELRSSKELTEGQGAILDKKQTIDEAEAYGASQAFEQVSILPVILIFFFGAIYLYDRSRGGYKVESIHGH